MSKFITKLPIDVTEVTGRLPSKSEVREVTWNGKELEIQWDNQDLETPFTFPVELTVKDLFDKKLPECVKNNQPLTSTLTIKKGVDEVSKKVDKSAKK